MTCLFVLSLLMCLVAAAVAQDSSSVASSSSADAALSSSSDAAPDMSSSDAPVGVISSSSGPFDPDNIYIQCGYVLFPNETIFTVQVANTTSGLKFQIYNNDDDSNANSEDNALVQPTIYLQRGYYYVFQALNQQYSFAITASDPSLTGNTVNSPLALTTANQDSNIAFWADSNGSGLLHLWYDVYYPNGMLSTDPVSMGQQLFVSDASLTCPESSTGQVVMYPDEDNLPGDNGAASNVIAFSITIVSVACALIMIF